MGKGKKNRMMREWRQEGFTESACVRAFSLATKFKRFCQWGLLEDAKKMYEMMMLRYPKSGGGQNIDFYESVFDNVCLGGHVEVAKWLYSVQPSIRVSVTSNTFVYVCEKGYLEMAKWLYDVAQTTDEGAKEAKDWDPIYMGMAFENVIACGHVELAKWMVRYVGMEKIKIPYFEGIRNACISGVLEIVKLLYSNMGDADVATFRRELQDYQGHLHIALLYAKTTNLECAKWIREMMTEQFGERTAERTAINSLVHVCEAGNLEIAQWIYSVCERSRADLTTRTFLTTAFEVAIRKDYLEMGEWLLSVLPDIRGEHLDEIFGLMCYHVLYLNTDVPALSEYKRAQRLKSNLNWVRKMVERFPNYYSATIVGTVLVEWAVTEVLLPAFVEKEVKVSAEVAAEMCIICTETKVNVQSQCGHSFCVKCINKWLQSNRSSCPCCREDVTELCKMVVEETGEEMG